jgi:hypothetical protein
MMTTVMGISDMLAYSLNGGIQKVLWAQKT